MIKGKKENGSKKIRYSVIVTVKAALSLFYKVHLFVNYNEKIWKFRSVRGVIIKVEGITIHLCKDPSQLLFIIFKRHKFVSILITA